MLSRRTTLLSALAAGAGALSASASASASAAPRAARFALPRPSGPWPVGASAYRLVDTARSDPWVPSLPYRELMVSVRYPAARTAGMPAVPQFLPGEAAGFAAANNLSGVPGDAVDWAATRTHARQGAPVAGQGGPSPVVLYSPGVLDPRSLNSTLCDDLASRGYVVVTVDHTYEASAVEFPGGRVATTVMPAEFAATGQDPVKITALLEKVIAVRVADTRFVLDRMPALLRRAVGGAADPHRVGMFGHSAGGFTALETMYEDGRIRAGVNLDGVLAYVTDDAEPGNLSSVAAHGLDRPFLLAGDDTDDLDTEPAWASLWQRSTGWHRGFRLEGAAHASYTDVQSIVPQLAKPLGLSAQTVESNVGTIPPHASIAAQRAYLAAFFDRHLRGKPDRGLFDTPSARYPRVHLFG